MSEFILYSIDRLKLTSFHSGQEDMNVEAMWERLGLSVENPRQYHL